MPTPTADGMTSTGGTQLAAAPSGEVSAATALSEGIYAERPANSGPSFFDRAAEFLHEQGVPMHECLDLPPFDPHHGDLADGIGATDHRLVTSR